MKEIVEKSLTYIDDNIQNHISLKNILDYVGYSEYHFSRLFKSDMGMSVMEYVLQRKMQRAVEDVISGVKIIDVALNYGYQSHAGFTKAFKARYGFSPIFLKAMKLELECLGGNTMGNDILLQIEEHATKEQLYVILNEMIHNSNIEDADSKIRSAYSFACRVYEGMNRYSGDEYVTHPLNVAILLVQLEASEKVIIAGMLCDALTKTNITKEEIITNISKEVYDILEKAKEFIVEEVCKENDDVIMLKLAERLHNMRTIKYMEDEKKRIKTKETLEIYMPLARKLGNERIIKELEMVMKC